jgi:hypothetical protein
MALPITVYVSTLAVVVALAFLSKKKNPALPYPPGPRARIPFLGNALEIPGESAWLKYTEWRKTYGLPLNLRNSITLANVHGAQAISSI